ncbi:hypothetical protein GCM10028857_18790 [Salinarchaeum chitinilyticum]
MTGEIEVSSLPDRLVTHDQWVCWRTKDRDGKATKVPIDPEAGGFASSTDPDTWTDVEAALDHLVSGGGNGLGFVFTEDDPLVGVDLDDCRNPETGAIDAEARDVIRRLDSYTEVSPSGTGFHVLLEGELPDGRNRRGSIECYDRARYFTVTGDVVADCPERIGYRQDALEALHREYLAEDSPDAPGDDGSSAREEPKNRASAVGIATGLGDDELLERARSAANGASSSDCGTGGPPATTATRRRTWRCVACWRSGPVAIVCRWTACFVVPDCCVTSGTRCTTPTARRTASGRSSGQ